MGPNQQAGNSPPPNPPDDSLKKCWQYLLKDLWPVILPQLLTSGGHGLPGEIRGQLLKGILPGILSQFPGPEGRESGPPSPSHFEEAREHLDRIKDPKTREELARVLAKAEAVPGGGSDPFEEESPPEPREKPSPEPEKPVPRDNVILLRKRAKEKRKRRRKIPRDILELPEVQELKRSELEIYRAMYRASWYGHSSKLLVWHSKRHRYGRFYFRGVAHLVTLTGWSDHTVRRALEVLKAGDLIYKRAHGYRSESNGIWELPYNRKHIHAWKSKPRG